METVHPEHQGEAWEGADDSDALLLRFQGGKLGIHSTTLTTPPRRDMCYIEGSVNPAASSGVVALDPPLAEFWRLKRWWWCTGRRGAS